MAAKRTPIYPVDRYRVRRALDAGKVSVATLAQEAGCDRSVIYRVLQGDLAGSVKLKHIYKALALDLELMNRHVAWPDAEMCVGLCACCDTSVLIPLADAIAVGAL